MKISVVWLKLLVEEVETTKDSGADVLETGEFWGPIEEEADAWVGVELEVGDELERCAGVTLELDMVLPDPGVEVGPDPETVPGPEGDVPAGEVGGGLIVVVRSDDIMTVVGAPETVKGAPFRKGSMTVLKGKNSE